MLEHKKIQNLSDYFVELNSRREKGVYFYRINGYSEEVGEFIKKYYDTARRTGVVIEGKIPNPDEGNLAYYNEIMGMDFQMSMDFIHVSLRKWLPRYAMRSATGMRLFSGERTILLLPFIMSQCL